MATQSKQSSLLPVYLIAGEDELKRETVMKRLFARLSKMGDMSFNSETFSGLTCTGEEVITAANTLPFASEVRLVVVNDVDKLKKADSELLVAYLKEPCETTVLALEGQKVAKNTRLYKAVLALWRQSNNRLCPICSQRSWQRCSVYGCRAWNSAYAGCRCDVN